MSKVDLDSGEGQTIEGKLAEIKGRSYPAWKILENPEEMAFLRQRAEETTRDISALRDRGIKVSPFLEVGAGSVQRSIALASDLKADGVATELVEGSLRHAPVTARVVGKDRLPVRIAADAQYLPFADNTFPFGFCYQTWHHLPNPRAALAEMHRVLGKDGHLFFAEEPMGSSLRVWLRGNRRLQEPPTKIQQWATKRGIENVFWRGGIQEEEVGIQEGYHFHDVWKQALEPFDKVEAVVGKRLQLKTDFRNPDLSSFLASILGGQFRALCEKTSGEYPIGNFRDRLICLDCRAGISSQVIEDQLACRNCDRVYPSIDGVIRMFPKALDQELYPGISV